MVTYISSKPDSRPNSFPLKLIPVDLAYIFHNPSGLITFGVFSGGAEAEWGAISGEGRFTFELLVG